MLKTVLARDLMTAPVRQLTIRTSVRDAAAFLVRHGISGAPVIDDHGHWVGVFTENDLARYVQGRIRPGTPSRTLESREAVEEAFKVLPDQFGDTAVSDLMTIGLYTVFPDATLEEVVHAMTAFNVHRVFVIQEPVTPLLGVITTMDILRWLEAGRKCNWKPAGLAKA